VSGDIDFDSSAVYVFDYSYGGDVVIGDSSIESIKDLKGKKIGIIALDSFSHRFLISLLEKNGLSEDDVEFIEVSAYDVLDALREGEIDAGHTWDPIKNEAIDAGYNLIASSKETPGLIVDVLVMKKSVIREREQDIQGVVSALERAYEFIKENKKESYSLMANRTGVSLADLAGVCKGIKLVSPEENILALTDSDSNISLYSTSEDISDFMIKRGQLNKGFSAEDLVDSRFVEKNGLLDSLLNIFKV
jgi:NitT/TauT family transport system substrate-binding protein